MLIYSVQIPRGRVSDLAYALCNQIKNCSMTSTLAYSGLTGWAAQLFKRGRVYLSNVPRVEIKLKKNLQCLLTASSSSLQLPFSFPTSVITVVPCNKV